MVVVKMVRRFESKSMDIYTIRGQCAEPHGIVNMVSCLDFCNSIIVLSD
jgi:hypothetical protein